MTGRDRSGGGAGRPPPRGEDGTRAGNRYAPPGASVTVVVEGDLIRTTVRAPVRVLGGDLPVITVVGGAVAVAEPGVPEPQS